ncbi:molybdopterin-dependent oxidoreductase [Paracoccus sp. KR1-242]|uniref:molybdopterin-dependent oxidoreductase n=1 Tax=Paracoccus sp. KR1-242 TaxID=3410028 RepID=UPI003C0C4A3B
MHRQTHRIRAFLPGLLALTLAGVPWAGSAWAAEQAVLNGPDGKVVNLTATMLAALPPTEATTAYRSSKGIEAGVYKGVLLWDLLQAEGILDQDHKTALRHVLLVTAGDGHQVAFSIGEIAPDFGNRPILLAYEMNGAPIPDGLRMVVPGDLRGARHIKDITTLDWR